MNRINTVPAETQATEAPPAARVSATDRWLVAVMAPIGLLQLYVIGTGPIPSGNRDAARVFLAEHFPQQAVHPGDSVTAPVAAVYHLIRSADPDAAVQALRFAAESTLGYGCPYAIERLESSDSELRDAAHAYLRAIAGRDYGPNVSAWRAWWRNPPRAVLGVIMGQRTAEHGALVLGVLAPLLFWWTGRLWLGPERRPDLACCMTVSFAYGLFMGFVLLSLRLVGGEETCRFGGETIVYHSIHGRVVGLEDARMGGGGLWVVLCAGFLAVWFVGMLGVVFGIIARHRGETQPDGRT